MAPQVEEWIASRRSGRHSPDPLARNDGLSAGTQKKHLQHMAFSPSTFAHERAPGAGVTAVLGPTNTGKTHLAIERMLAHSSGVIGLPLRLWRARSTTRSRIGRALRASR